MGGSAAPHSLAVLCVVAVLLSGAEAQTPLTSLDREKGAALLQKQGSSAKVKKSSKLRGWFSFGHGGGGARAAFDSLIIKSFVEKETEKHGLRQRFFSISGSGYLDKAKLSRHSSDCLLDSYIKNQKMVRMNTMKLVQMMAAPLKVGLKINHDMIQRMSKAARKDCQDSVGGGFFQGVSVLGVQKGKRPVNCFLRISRVECVDGTSLDVPTSVGAALNSAAFSFGDRMLTLKHVFKAVGVGTDSGYKKLMEKNKWKFTDRGLFFNQPTMLHEYDKQNIHLIALSPRATDAERLPLLLRLDMCHESNANKKILVPGLANFLIGRKMLDPYVTKDTCFDTMMFKPFTELDYYLFTRGQVMNVVVVLRPKSKAADWKTEALQQKKSVMRKRRKLLHGALVASGFAELVRLTVAQDNVGILKWFEDASWRKESDTMVGKSPNPNFSMS